MQWVQRTLTNALPGKSRGTTSSPIRTKRKKQRIGFLTSEAREFNYNSPRKATSPSPEKKSARRSPLRDAEHAHAGNIRLARTRLAKLMLGRRTSASEGQDRERRMQKGEVGNDTVHARPSPNPTVAKTLQPSNDEVEVLKQELEAANSRIASRTSSWSSVMPNEITSCLLIGSSTVGR